MVAAKPALASVNTAAMAFIPTSLLVRNRKQPVRRPVRRPASAAAAAAKGKAAGGAGKGDAYDTFMKEMEGLGGDE